MKEVLFKSKDLTIVASSDGAVIYGTTTRKSALEYLRNLTPETTREAISLAELCTLICICKYITAKRIAIVSEVTVEVAKSSAIKTVEDALRVASKFDLKAEVQKELDNGATPLEALRKWDIVQFNRVLSKTLNCSLLLANNKRQSCKINMVAVPPDVATSSVRQ